MSRLFAPRRRSRPCRSCPLAEPLSDVQRSAPGLSPIGCYARRPVIEKKVVPSGDYPFRSGTAARLGNRRAIAKIAGTSIFNPRILRAKVFTCIPSASAAQVRFRFADFERSKNKLFLNSLTPSRYKMPVLCIRRASRSRSLCVAYLCFLFVIAILLWKSSLTCADTFYGPELKATAREIVGESTPVWA